MSISSYRTGLRAPVRALFTGAMDFDQFFDAMMTAIRRGITQAWNQGAKLAGVAENELTPQEMIAREQTINNEFNYITGLAARIDEIRDTDGKLGSAFNLLGAWVNRWQDAKNRAQEIASTDPKLKWNLGVAEHCTSCVKLSGKIKRASYWNERGVHPQQPPNELLECGGWECKCFFTPTNEQLSKGPLPRLP